MTQKNLKYPADEFDLLQVIQYAFPMVFVLLAFGFYWNDRLPALMAWTFAAVGFIEYCLIGILRLERNRQNISKFNEA